MTFFKLWGIVKKRVVSPLKPPAMKVPPIFYKSTNIVLHENHKGACSGKMVPTPIFRVLAHRPIPVVLGVLFDDRFDTKVLLSNHVFGSFERLSALLFKIVLVVMVHVSVVFVLGMFVFSVFAANVCSFYCFVYIAFVSLHCMFNVFCLD